MSGDENVGYKKLRLKQQVTGMGVGMGGGNNGDRDERG